MPFFLNGVLLPRTDSNQRAIAAAKHRADLIGVQAAAVMLGVDARTLRRWHDHDVGPKRKNREGKRPIRYSRLEVQQFAAIRNGKRLVRVQLPASGHSDADLVQPPANGHSETLGTPALVSNNLEIK
jgi:MerR HTH family regulatory protein